MAALASLTTNYSDLEEEDDRSETPVSMKEECLHYGDIDVYIKNEETELIDVQEVFLYNEDEAENIIKDEPLYEESNDIDMKEELYPQPERSAKIPDGGQSTSNDNSSSKVVKKHKKKTEPTEPLSAYAVFIREQEAQAGKNEKLKMPHLNSRWKQMTVEERAPFQNTARQEKMTLIENGTYRMNRKKKINSKVETIRKQKDRRFKEKLIKSKEKETSMAVIYTLTKNNQNLTESNLILSKDLVEEKRRSEVFQKVAMDSQKLANEWKEKFIVVRNKYEAMKQKTSQE